MSTKTKPQEVVHDPDQSVLDTIRGARDALTVKRVFGDPVEVDGITVIPAARIAGGAGGGSGSSNDGEDDSGDGDGVDSGSGSGSGFGLRATPVGAYQVRDGALVWMPAVDVNQLARAGMTLAGVIAGCVTIVVLSRR